MKKWPFLFAFAAAGAVWWHEPQATWKGLPAKRDPQQDTQQLPGPFKVGELTLTPLARYGITAIVLDRERYRHDAAADLAPVDLALGWGPMSSSEIINALSFSQSGRWYQYRWESNAPPLDPSAIARHSANTHCLPATPEIRRKLFAVDRHDLVAMGGYLVEVRGEDGFVWRSSLSRDDVAGGSCEVFWITTLESAGNPASKL